MKWSQDPAATRARSDSYGKPDWLACAVIVVLGSLFFLSYFNRFAGIRSGAGEWSGGMALLSGILPYRDYYTAGPPLNQGKSALELLLFGKALIVSRAAAVLERLALALLLYAWLRRSFSLAAATLASIVTIIVSAGDRSDPLASYNHDAILFAILGGYAACRSLDRDTARQVIRWAILAGVAASLSALTKQTVGLGVAATLLFLGSAASRARIPAHAPVWLLCYLVGLTAPLLVLAGCLHHAGLLRPALHMLFITGPSAKASGGGAFLRRALFIGKDNAPWVLLGISGLLLSGRALWRGLPSCGTEQQKPAPSWLMRLLLLGIALFAGCELLSRYAMPAVWNFSKSAVYYSLFGLSLTAGALLIRSMLRHNSPKRLAGRHWELLLFTGVGWVVAMTLALSWPAFEAMTLPGLAMLLAACVDGVQKGKPALYGMLAILVAFQLREKLDLPFSFGFQDEMPVRSALGSSFLPELRGMRLPGTSLDLLQQTACTAATHTTAGDTVFTYPEMGILNTLTRRRPPTWAGSHNIDVIPDDFTRQEAERIRAHPPALLVYSRPAEQALVAEEQLWRDGKRSGQRALVAVLDQLTAEYPLVATYVLKPGDNPIRIYLRPDRMEPLAVAPDRCP